MGPSHYLDMISVSADQFTQTYHWLMSLILSDVVMRSYRQPWSQLTGAGAGSCQHWLRLRPPETRRATGKPETRVHTPPTNILWTRHGTSDYSGIMSWNLDEIRCNGMFSSIYSMRWLPFNIDVYNFDLLSCNYSKRAGCRTRSVRSSYCKSSREEFSIWKVSTAA